MVFDTRPRFGAPSIFTRRSRLQGELYRLATDPSRSGKPAHIIDGVNIKSVNPTTGQVVTESGETYSGDLIIGADGINSSVRAAIQIHSLTSEFRPDPNIRVSGATAAVPTGLVAYISVVPVALLASEPTIAFQIPEGVAGICHWQGDDLSRYRILCYPCDNKEYYQILAYAPEDSWSEEFEKHKSNIIRDVPAERVLKEFEQFSPTVKKLLRHVFLFVMWAGVKLTLHLVTLQRIVFGEFEI